MEQTVYSKEKGLPFILLKALVRMKLTVFILLFGCLQASAFVHAQSITLSLNKAPFPSFIKEVEAQTGYRFVYLKEQMEKASAVTLHVVNSPLLEVLSLSFKDQPLDFTIEDKLIIIRNKKLQQPALPVAELRGRVVNREGEPMAGVSIRLKNSSRATVTDESGEFILREIDGSAILEISGAEIEKMEVPVNGRQYLTITVKAKISNLDQVIVMAYGQTTQRLNTGNIVKVTAEEIERQPVSNPLAALQGRVPGMVVTQTSGVPGSAFKVEIRGRSSLDLSLSRNDPLFIIDGVPFEPGNLPSNQLISAANKSISISQGGLSPLNSINPADIESIEILKDADATAIYGSRGANGVILITTRKGVTDKFSVRASFAQGWSTVTRTMDMLSTSEYLNMRKEAFKNDKVEPDNYNAPDLLLWDTTRYTDFKKLLIGRTAQSANAQLSVSGGDKNTNFLLSGGFFRQNNVFSKDLHETRGSLHFNLSHRDANNRLTLQFSGMYSADVNHLITTDLTSYINTIPNLKLYEEDESLSWQEGGVYYSVLGGMINPLSLLEKNYNSLNTNINANVNLSYELFKGLKLKSNFGYSSFFTKENSSSPSTSFQPNTGIKPSANFANSNTGNWIVEPQLEYKERFAKEQDFTVLIGASLQHTKRESEYIQATQYENDLLLGTPAAAGRILADKDYSVYTYAAVFSRIQYNAFNKYLLNLSVRRDGSSRFGPGKRFSNFGALGAAWLFSGEDFISKNFTWLNHGKIRVSYGITGNDQIGDYKYLDLWTTSQRYQGIPSLLPENLFNPNFNWEKRKKTEVGVELGFLRDIVFFSVSWYRNRSSNQLVSYRLPEQTGFSSIIRNFPALVENKGWEMVFSVSPIRKDKIHWNTSFNITLLPTNKLLAFPGLESSSYSSLFKIGESVNTIRGYNYLGIDEETGVYTFEEPLQFLIRGNIDPKFYGGLSNNLKAGNWNLNFLFEFRKQTGKSYLESVANTQPGRPINQPKIVLNRWQEPGDNASVQQYTSMAYGLIATPAFYLSYSNGIYSDASFIRLKNISLSYTLSEVWTGAMRIKDLNFFLSCQNLFVITNFKGADPENQDIYMLPPLRTISAGITLNL